MVRRLLGMVVLAGTMMSTAQGAISEDRVLIVVNAASAVSDHVARMYREYHPGIPDSNVVYLSGLNDIQTPADEIVSRMEYEWLIAEPIRRHLIDQGLVDQVWVIVTTAGMPYRIADTRVETAVTPAASNPFAVQDSLSTLNAASVESELTMLFQTDPALDRPQRAPLAGRMVNPYHGYVSPFEAFSADRDVLGRRGMFCFKAPDGSPDTVYESAGCMEECPLEQLLAGECNWSVWRAVWARQFSVDDLYLVARLDGPWLTAASNGSRRLPVGSVRRMLESAARAGGARGFGHDPSRAVVVLDDDTVNLDQNRMLNAGNAVAWDAYPQDYLRAEEYLAPPDSTGDGSARDDFRVAYRSLTHAASLPDRIATEPICGVMSPELLGGQVVFDATAAIQSQASLGAGSSVIGLATFGTNASDTRSANYLLTGGIGGSRFVEPAYGAVFASLESYSAVTFFSDAWTGQAKLADWIAIGGAGAIGYAFEPLGSSAADVDLLLYNYLRDEDGDGWGDMTFVEAAYTSMPFISWAGVVVGDPLMRLRVAETAEPCVVPAEVVIGDLDWDGQLMAIEMGMMYWVLTDGMGSQIGDVNYDDRVDCDQDGSVLVTDYDMMMAAWLEAMGS